MFNAPDGINFSCETLRAPELSRVLCRVAAFLQEIEPHGARFQKYEDWWEHDGLHFHTGAPSIHELFEIVKSPRSLLATTQDDDVFIGVAPDSQRWYLRFYLTWDDEGFDLSGRFDITLPPELAPGFEQRVGDLVTMKKQDAKAYYEEIKV